MIKLFPLLAGIIISTSTIAQKPLEIAVVLGPGLSNVHVSDDWFIDYDNTFRINAGVELSKRYGKIKLTTGIWHLNQGASDEISFIWYDDNGNYENINAGFTITARAFSVPLKFSYDLFLLKRSSFSIGGGVYLGYLYSEFMDQTDLHQQMRERDPDINFRFEDISETEIYDDFYVGLNLGVNWSTPISDNFAIEISPNILYQPNKEQEELSNGLTRYNLRLYSFSMNIGLRYSLQ